MSGSIELLLLAVLGGGVLLIGYCLEVKSYSAFGFGAFLFGKGIVAIFSGSLSQHSSSAVPLEGFAARVAGAILLMIGIQCLRISFHPKLKNKK